MLERAGAAGIQIEDQVFPKKCGHFKGKDVVPLGDMVQKIKAAVDSRRDGDFQIVARTDARAVRGFEEGIERAHAFIEAGADVTFVEAPVSTEELAKIAKLLPVPQIANMVFGGLTPAVPQNELAEMGFGARALRQRGVAGRAQDRCARSSDRSSRTDRSTTCATGSPRSTSASAPSTRIDYDALEARYRD